jgi:hypothetical protein
VIEPRERDEASARHRADRYYNRTVYWHKSLMQAPDEGTSPPIGRRIEGAGLRPRRIVAGTGVLASPLMNVGLTDPVVNQRALCDRCHGTGDH